MDTHIYITSALLFFFSSTLLLFFLGRPAGPDPSFLSDTIIVPDMDAGCCLRPEGKGVSSGEGGDGGPGPPGGGKDKQSVLSMGMDNMGKDEEDQTSQT